MRLAFRNTLHLLVIYAVVLVILAGAAMLQLLAFEAKVQKETARLFAREVASALTEPSLDRLMQADRGARQSLRTMIEQLTRHSQVVSSIAVVDRNGRVVASDDSLEHARLSTPDEVFGGSRRWRFITFGAFPFPSGSYQLSVPLAQRGASVGYLQIGLHSQSVADMNRRMWDWLALAAVCGLLCIAGLGYALHLQLARQRRSLAATLESAIRGESTSISPELGEFSQAIEAAQRAGREVHLARDRSARDRGRFVTLGEILNVGVLMTNRAGELEFASARGRQMFGCEDDAHLATRLNEMRGTFDEALRRRTRDGRDDVRLDVEPARDSDGRHLRLEVYPLDHGTTEGRLILVRDRTNMKALETDLRLASQLRGLARLYLTVVHDIRAPLAALVAHTELLGRSLDDESGSTNGAGERRRGYIAVMEDELQRLRRSLDSLLNHATLPRDELEELDARELISDLEVLLRPQCDRQKVALSASVPDTPIRVLGTRDALKQALVNIGINALEAMPGGGALALRLEAADARAVVSVADTGGGIPPSVRDKIFTMHFTTKSSGTGIGLYVARAVVESNGGEIHVSSDVGHGTTFEIDLPALATGG